MSSLCFDGMLYNLGEEKRNSNINEGIKLFWDFEEEISSNDSSIISNFKKKVGGYLLPANVTDIKTNFKEAFGANEVCSTKYLNIKKENSNSSGTANFTLNEQEINVEQKFTPEIIEVASLGDLNASANHITVSTNKKENIAIKIKEMDITESLLVTKDNDQRIYKCPTCMKSFTSQKSLKKHAHMHSKPKNPPKIFECEICLKQFKMKHHLQRHLLCHTDEKSYNCAECGKNYRDKHDLAVHMANHHEKQKCSDCGVVFNNKIELNKHSLSHKPNSTIKSALKCHICQKEFKEKRYLKTHLLVHTKNKPFVCDECAKSFGNKWQLEEHCKVHTGENLFVCDVCDKAFSKKSNMLRHKNSHNTTHTCVFCCAIFNEVELLREHRKTCKLVYECGKCNFVSKKFSNLKRHLKTHTKDLSDDEITKSNFEAENAIVRLL